MAVAAIAAVLPLGMAPPAFAANWYASTTIGVPESGDQLRDPWGVAVAPNGNVYVAETGSHIIKIFDPAGAPLGSFGGFGNAPGQLWAPRDLAVAADGTVYVCDTYNHRIQRFSATGATLGVFGGPGSGPLQFSQPLGIAAAPDGTVYVADEGNSRVQRLAADGTFLAQWGTAGTGPGQFSGPTGIAVTPDGSVFVAEHYGNRLQKFTAGGAHLFTVGSAGAALGQMLGPVNLDAAPDGSVVMAEVWGNRVQRFAADGTALATMASGLVSNPRGVAVAPDGTVVVADTAGNRIRRLTAAGVLAATWARPVNDPGQLHAPGSIARAADGSVWVVEPPAQRVSHFAANGTFLGSVGSAGSGNGQFSWPHAVAAAPDGTIYVTDYWNHRVQRFSAAGTFLSTFGSAGTGLGSLSNPEGVTVAPDGTVLVADRGNGRVQRFTATGVPLSSFGTPGVLPGQLDLPHQVAVLGDGTVLVSEEGSNRLQRFSMAGAPLGVIGSGGAGPGQFSGPFGLGEMAGGDLVVADAWNRRVQRLDASGAPLASFRSAVELGIPAGVALNPDSSIWVSDGANHRIALLAWDDEKPLASISATPIAGGVTFSATASDAQSGLAAAAWSWDGGATWGPRSSHTVSGLGYSVTASVSLVVRDAADNEVALAASSASLPEPPDETPPRIELQSRLPGAALGRGASLQFRFTDARSAIVLRSATWRGRRVPVVGGEVDLSQVSEGDGTVRVLVRDAAGNEAIWARRLTLDFTAPKIAARGTLGNFVGRGGRIPMSIGAGERGPVSRTATWRGERVELVGGAVEFGRAAGGGVGTLLVTASDAAGNTSTWRRRLLLDRSAPVVLDGRWSRTLGPTARVRAADAGSGIAEGVVVAAPHLGRNLVEVDVQDRAGNHARRVMVVERHLSLASPWRNAGLRLDADSGDVVTVFAFAGPNAPWYSYHAQSPPLVREAQWRLQELGYLSIVARRSGHLDLATIRAVQRYQSKHGLPVLGTIGPRTRRQLDADFARFLSHDAPRR